MTEDRMTKPEAVMLCRFAKACCPQQAFDEYTPDAWFELLRDLRAQDVKDAIIRVVKQQPFVSPAEIRKQMTMVRIDRLEKFGRVTPPPELADDPAAEQKWIAALERRVADGEITREEYDRQQPVLKARNVQGAIAGAFRKIPSPVHPAPVEPEADPT